jgi:hypothetical protein
MERPNSQVDHNAKLQYRYSLAVDSLSMQDTFSDGRTDLSFSAVIVSSTCPLYLQFYMVALQIVVKSPSPCGYLLT